MILQVCAVYDSKARAFLVPFFSSTLDVALRAFRDAANQPDHQVCKYPEDFTLFHLGRFDDDTGTFSLLLQHTNLGLAAAFKISREIKNVRSEGTQVEVSDETPVFTSSEGGDSAKHV